MMQENDSVRMKLFVNWKFSRMLTASKAVTIPFHKDYSSSR